MDGIKRPLLKKEEVSHYLQISTRTLDRLVKNGLITPIRIGKQVRFTEDVIINKSVA
jgi:excisionase family DNA binding protein